MKPGKKPFTTKVCPGCKVEKPRSEYYKKLETVSYLCKPCSVAKSKSRAPKYKGRYIEWCNDWRRNKVATDPKWIERRRKTKKKRYDAVKDAENLRRREAWANDPYCSARGCNQRRDVKTQTPAWADKTKITRI